MFNFRVRIINSGLGLISTPVYIYIRACVNIFYVSHTVYFLSLSKLVDKMP